MGAGVYGKIAGLAMDQEFYIMGTRMLLADILSKVKIKKHEEQLIRVDQLSLERGM